MITKKIGKTATLCVAQDIKHTLLFNGKTSLSFLVRNCDVEKVSEIEITIAIDTDDKVNE